jgi:NDP-sugar pyrophosphorylase family protein
MKAMILAAGEGTRLRPLTSDRPKPMLDLAGRPLIAHLIELLRRHGVTEIAVNLHHKPEALQSYLGDGAALGVRITYSYEDALMGTAGAVKKIARFFDERFFVLYGDVLTDMDLSSLASFHLRQRPLLTMALHRAEDPTRCGIVEIDTRGRVKRFVEKPAPPDVFSPWANAGVYVIEPEALRWVPEDAFFDFGSDLIPLLIQENAPVMGYVSAGYFLDIGSPARYQQAQCDLASGLLIARSFTQGSGKYAGQ